MPRIPALSASKPLLHPGVWRASEFSRDAGQCLAAGYGALAAELPGGGWPCGNLIEFLLARPGIGEMQLLRPALATLPARRSVVLLQPPHVPHIACLTSWRPDPAQTLWLRPKSVADALWAAEQVLKAGTCAALLGWFPQIHATALRRLHAAAQGCDILFVALRPAQAERQASPAVLRLALQPAPDGLSLRLVKRRGPPRDTPLYLRLRAAPSRAIASNPEFSHAPLDSHSSVPIEPRRAVPPLAGLDDEDLRKPLTAGQDHSG